MKTTKTETDTAPESGAPATPAGTAPAGTAPETTPEAAPATAPEASAAPGVSEVSDDSAGDSAGDASGNVSGDASGDPADDSSDDEPWGYEEIAAGSDAEPSARSGAAALVTGAGAVIGAALALSSVTGTWLSNVVSQREGLIGQIKSANGTPKAQIAAGYGTPWHTIALVNGSFAVIALLVSGAVLLHPASRARATRGHWSQAVAWGGAVLALIGLLIAAALWFDVFADLPQVPTAPAAG